MAITSQPQDSDGIIAEVPELNGKKFIQTNALIQFFNDLTAAINDLQGNQAAAQEIGALDIRLTQQKAALLQEIEALYSGARLAHQLDLQLSALRIPDIRPLQAQIAELVLVQGKILSQLNQLEQRLNNVENIAYGH